MAEEKPEARPGRVSVEVACRLLNTSPDRLRKAERWGYIPVKTRDGYVLAELVNGYTKFLEEGEVTQKEAGVAIGTTDQWVRNLIADGYVTKTPNGNVRIRDVMLGYIRFLKDEERRSNKSAAGSSLKAAREREVELRMAQTMRHLIPYEDAQASIDGIVGMFRAELAGLPARVTRDIRLRDHIEQEVHGVLDRLSKRAGEEGKALETGQPAFEADTSDDA